MELIEAPVKGYIDVACPGCGKVLKWKDGQRTKRCTGCGRRWRQSAAPKIERKKKSKKE